MKKTLSVSGWQDIGADYQSSLSRELIGNAVKRLMNGHLPIFLAGNGYQSGPTILIGTNEQGLLI